MFVPAFTVQWSYVAMTSRMTAVDQTSGEFGFTRKDEWQIVPKRTAKQWRTYLGPFRRDGGTFSLVGSIHLATYEIRATGPSTCHVRLFTTKLRTSSFDFDLSASSQDVVGTLERLGEGTVKHPWYPQDEGPYQRDVIQGDLTTVKFERLAN
ncbi:MAG TPA: hypothetical protein VGP11_06850 [Acidimicrobiales bacterium]|nr:hypothetical protein [Acidimicrobiales bacterium]